MTEYVVLIPGNEAQWAEVEPAERERVYGLHQRFAAALAERGHKITGGAELVPSREARTVRTGANGLEVTEGPYAESVEQLSGFYTIESDDLDDLLEVVGILARGESGVEVRACVGGSAGPA
jgi:hypothetical protein